MARRQIYNADSHQSSVEPSTPVQMESDSDSAARDGMTELAAMSQKDEVSGTSVIPQPYSLGPSTNKTFRPREERADERNPATVEQALDEVLPARQDVQQGESEESPLLGGGASFSALDFRAESSFDFLTAQGALQKSGLRTHANGQPEAFRTNAATSGPPLIPVNNPPTTNDVAASGPEDAAAIAITLAGNDVDGAVQSFLLSREL